MKIHLLGVASVCCLFISGCATQLPNAPVRAITATASSTSTMRVIDRAGFEKPPVSLHRVPPDLTRWDLDTLRRFPSVAVEIGTVIGEDGIPSEIKILNSEDEDIGGAVARVIQSWRFEPAIKDGNPVRCQVVLRMVLKYAGPNTHGKAEHLMRQIL